MKSRFYRPQRSHDNIGKSHFNHRASFHLARLVAAAVLLALAGVILAPGTSHAAVTPVAWYRLGENDPGALNGAAAASTKDVVFNRTLTLVNGPRYTNDVAVTAAARVGSSLGLHFPGNASGTNAVVSTATDNFGIELWVKPTTASGIRGIAYNGNPGLNGWGLFQINGTYQAIFGNVGFIGSGPITAGEWTHLALVRTNGTANLYVNGVVSGAFTATPHAPQGLFALAPTPDAPTVNYLDGSLDEVRVFTFAPGQFTADDLLLNRYPGIGNALSLDGSSQYISLSSVPAFATDFTVESWVYVRSYNHWSRVLDFGNGPANDNVILALSEERTGRPVLSVYNGGLESRFTATSPLPLNQWAHLAATLSGTNGTIYINGVVAGTGSVKRPNHVTRTSNYIGRSNWSNDGYAHAIFDELRIWNVARNSAQILSEMDRPLTGAEADLVAYWPFGESSGAVAADASGHGLAGALMNNPARLVSTAPMPTALFVRNRLSIGHREGNVIINFEGTLQAADSLNGPFVDLATASPYTPPVGGASKFYRAYDASQHGSVFNQQIKLLSYNAHLFEGSTAAFFSSSVVYEDSIRMELIAQQVENSGADIVGFQEVWDDDNRTTLRDRLVTTYPFSFIPPDSGGAAHPQGSGLLLLSKWPLQSPSYFRYHDLEGDFVLCEDFNPLDPFCWENEDLSMKGVVSANVLINGSLAFRISTTHAATDLGGRPGQPNMVELAQRGTLQDAPTILMGDFNAHLRDYQRMDSILSGHGAFDAWRKVHGNDTNNSQTIDKENNLLDQTFSPSFHPNPIKPDRSEGVFDRIDYTYVSRAGDRSRLDPISASVIRDWKYTNSSRYTGFTASAPPSIVVFNGLFHVFFRDGTGNGLLHVTSPDGINWRPAEVWHPDFTTSAGPRAVVYQGRLHIFFRDGTGNGILDIASDDGNNFSPADWYFGHNCDGQPSAAVLNDRLCLVAIDRGGNGIMFSVRTPAGWQRVYGYTGFTASAPPSIVAFNGRFHVFFRDGTGNGLLHITSADGINWAPAEVWHPDFTTSAGPEAVVYQNKLHIFFRDGVGNGLLSISSTDGNNFSPTIWPDTGGWYFGANRDGQPSAAVLNDRLCLVAIDHGGNGIMSNVRAGQSWSFPIDLSDHFPLTTTINCTIDTSKRLLTTDNGYTGYTASDPATIVAFQDKFHAYYRYGSRSRIYHMTSPDGITWGPPSELPGHSTSAGPCAVVLGETVHLFYRDGTGNGIYHFASTDSQNFSSGGYTGFNRDAQPSAAVLSNRLCVVALDAGGSGIMSSVHAGVPWQNRYTGHTSSKPPTIVAFKGKFHVYYRDGAGSGIYHMTSPDGITWPPPSLLSGHTTSEGPCAVVQGEKVHLFYRDGAGNGLLHFISTDGDNFRPAQFLTRPSYYTELNCDGQPQAAALNETVCVLAIDAGGRGIMRSVLTPR